VEGGCNLRDSTPDIYFAAAGSLTSINDALHAEAESLSHAIQVAEQQGIGRVIFETDCINLQQAMTTT
jgi:hypothetical protein